MAHHTFLRGADLLKQRREYLYAYVEKHQVYTTYERDYFGKGEFTGVWKVHKQPNVTTLQ